MDTNALTADTIIVGGGTAGCVLARRLSECGERVLVLEAGGRYRRLFLGPPLPSQRLRPYFSWNYETTPQRGLGGRKLDMPLGKVLGGSSSTNAMMYCRGRDSDYDRWETLGNLGWNAAEAERQYGQVEAYDQPAGPNAIGSGRFSVNPPRFHAPFSNAFLAACKENGIEESERLNGEPQGGSGFFDVAQLGGERSSTAVTHLPGGDGLSRRQILTGARASRLLIEGDRVRGVEFRRGGRLHRAEAERRILLCAGAAHTPQLLMLSGVGPAEALKGLGVQVAVDLPGVGRNLQDHVRIPVLYETPAGSPGDKRKWVGAAIEYVFKRTGVMASNCCEAGAFVRSRPDLAEPDLQFVTHFQHTEGPGLVDLQFCLMSIASRGKLTLRSSSPDDAPLIDPGYLQADADIEACLKGLELARVLARSSAMRAFPLGKEYWPGSELQSREDLTEYLRRSAEPCYHLAGTCKMGADSDAVVDSELRVRGLDRLHIVDASVLPELIHGNTMAPIAMIAERAAEFLTGRQGRGGLELGCSAT